MMSGNEKKIPFALFNSKALFNPYQYLPFEKIMEWKDGKYVLNGKNLLITDEVGVGKTFEAGIILQELLQNKPDLTVLILCPVKLCANWVSELAENFYIGAENYRESKTVDQITVIPYSAFSNKSAQSMQEEIENEKELIKPDDKQENCTLIDDLKEQLRHYDVLILDEAHYVRNSGKLWEGVKQLESIESGDGLRIFMTGTPIFNRAEDYDNIIELLTGGYSVPRQFETTRTLQGEANCYDNMLEIKYGGLNEGKPGTLIPWNGQEASVYSEICKTEEVEADDYYDDDSDDPGEDDEIREVSVYGNRTGILKRLSSSSFYVLKKWIESRKEDDGFTDLADRLKDYSTERDSKLGALKDLLHYLKKDNGSNFPGTPLKAIIFSSFRMTCEYLNKMLGSDYNVGLITGQTGVKEVNRVKLEFKDTKNDYVLICSDAAKEGHNLQFCHYIIHYDLPFTPAAIGQRNGRIYRKGQKADPKCFYMLMGTDNSHLAGYDERLFGEIIMEKCQLVGEAADQKIISKMNILPGDSRDILESYINNYLGLNGEESEKQGVEDQGERDKIIKRAKYILKKRYYDPACVKSDNDNDVPSSDKNEKDWVKSKAEELYNKLESLTSEGLIKEIKRLLLTDFVNEMNPKDLYIPLYIKRLEDFMKEHFGYVRIVPDNEESDNADDSYSKVCDEFINVCKEYIEKSGICVEDHKYCHDMMRDEKMSIEEYKKQFKALSE